MKLKKQTLGIIGVSAVFLVVVGAGLFWWFSSADTTQITTDVVRRERLVQSIDVTGELVSIDRVDLSFDSSGVIQEILVDVGDVVEAGQLLARLDDAELAASVSRAQALYAQTSSGSTAQEVLIAEANVAVSKASLEAALASEQNALREQSTVKVTTDAAIAEAETSLIRARDDANRSTVEQALAVDSARSSFITDMTGAVIAIRSGLAAADRVLGIENTLLNDDFERELAAADPQSLTNAKNSFDRARDARDAAEEAVYGLPSVASEGQMLEAYAKVVAALDEVSLTLLYTARVLDATYADTADFSLAELNTLKAEIEGVRSATQTAENSFNAAKSAYDGQIAAQETAAIAMRNAIAAAEQAVVSSRASQSERIAAADSAVVSAKSTVLTRTADLQATEARLADVSAPVPSVDLRPLAADIESAQARLARARITAAFDGAVTRVDKEENEVVGAGERIFTLEAVGNQFELPLDIPESDIAKIALGDTVTITFDAFNNGADYSGVVSAIDFAEKVIEGVVYYEATVRFSGDSDLSALRPGMSADAVIVTDVRESALSVPQRAVLERDGQRYVRVVRGDGYEERAVTIGIRADGGRIEILSGLEEGERIVVSIKE
ncbi:efflux RND transporter periplasmic adaptor subunit [Patescibacteria group bacterium]|nr:efflux RND transporter periplasmic adaptor subunit [Patescibacteria group bacterium]